jgi:DNA ligase-1
VQHAIDISNEKLNENQMPKEALPTIYKRNASGKIQQWTIVVDGDGFYTEEGIVDGKITKSALHTCEPTNVGKANATTANTQAKKEAIAKRDKKLSTGYMTTIEAIDTTTFKKPMKGDKWADREDEVTFPVIVQDKLNGVRCQITKGVAHSTGGKIFHTIPHIHEALAPVFKKYPNAFIDGELFNYELRKNLNQLIELVSVVVQPKDLTPELLASSEEIVQFHAFDGFGFEGITPDMPYIERYKGLTKLLKNYQSGSCIDLLGYEISSTKKTLLKQLAATKPLGGEGLMIRWGDCPYKNGRSKYLLKMKHFEDAEFEIVDIQEGNANWKGKAKRIILKLHKPATNTTQDETFASNIEGNEEWLEKLFNERKDVIGKMATVEFQQYSEYGIPQIPFVRAIRDYE